MMTVKRRRARSRLAACKNDVKDSTMYVDGKTLIHSSKMEQLFPPPDTSEEKTGLVDPHIRHNPFSKSRAHRCTYYKPSNEDFGQLTDVVLPPNNYYQTLLQEVCSEVPASHMVMRNACQGSQIRTRSQYVEPDIPQGVDEDMMVNMLGDDAHWQAIDDVSEIDSLLPNIENEMLQSKSNLIETFPKNVYISETPRVKRIAEKYSKFNRNNIELRKLEERVVCLEYDIFDLNADPSIPVQKMKAFFAIKSRDSNKNGDISIIPSGVKREFNIEDGDLQNLNKKEIEIIDDKIAENRAMLEDLKRVLRRKQAHELKKKQDTLDLVYLYEMAKRESVPVNENYSNTNLLSKAELQEIKDLIIKKCASSVHGINRRTMKCNKASAQDTQCVISNSLISELMRECDRI